MAKPNPRYQLYDEVENRPPNSGRGYPMKDLGRREVCGPVPGTFLPCRLIQSMATPDDRSVLLNDCQGSWNSFCDWDDIDVPPDENKPDEFDAVMSQSGKANLLSQGNINSSVRFPVDYIDVSIKVLSAVLVTDTLGRHRVMHEPHAHFTNPLFYTHG